MQRRKKVRSDCGISLGLALTTAALTQASPARAQVPEALPPIIVDGASLAKDSRIAGFTSAGSHRPPFPLERDGGGGGSCGAGPEGVAPPRISARVEVGTEVGTEV